MISPWFSLLRCEKTNSSENIKKHITQSEEFKVFCLGPWEEKKKSSEEMFSHNTDNSDFVSEQFEDFDLWLHGRLKFPDTPQFALSAEVSGQQ